MRRGPGTRWLFVVAIIGGAGGITAAAQAPQLAALGRIEPGLWQMKEAGGDVRSICVADPRVLLQLEHGATPCSRIVIADDPRSATIHYTCPGAGHGRTTITIETGGLFGLQTQGIRQGAPFDFDYEARRIGNCPGAPAAR